jgi:hypothetical protein
LKILYEEIKGMKEQSGPMNRCEAYRPHGGRFLLGLVPLAVGFMLGVRMATMRQMMGHRKSWENGVPPIFAELHRRAHAAADQPAATEA